MTIAPRRRAYLGSDSVYYCENSAGHIFITSPYSPVPEGFVRKVADTAADAERVWKRVDEQTRRDHAQLTEADYARRAERITRFRSSLQSRMTSAECSQFERDAIRYALDFCDRKEQELNRNTVYGVAAMQEREAPVAPAPPAPPAPTAQKVTLTDAS